MPILTLMFALVAFVCWIIMLIKIFKAGETLYGVLGIFCGIVAFVYGWSKADDLDAKPIMLAWTASIIAYVISLFAGIGNAPVAQ